MARGYCFLQVLYPLTINHRLGGLQMLETITPTTPVLLQDLGALPISSGSKYKARYGIYRCQCGNEFTTQTTRIKSGHTKSCGCYQKQRASDANTTHGLSSHPLFFTWASMVSRCHNPNDDGYSYYGGRGIIVCDEWRYNPQAFFDWNEKLGRTGTLTTERKNNDGDYTPDNCRLATKAEQARNTIVICSNNTSGYKGIYLNNNSRWVAKIGVNNKHIFLGTYPTAIDAAKAYDKYVIDNKLEHTVNGVL